ncbi:uncharacterized protein [Amphiura filiformis]|uniref:uncharacterized protein n=1 Tax=Amphiura filiformis TaxID=82378 RepID=UPI003B228169
MFRLDKLAHEYGGWIDLWFTGLLQIRKFFSQLGLTNRNENIDIPDNYAGNVSLYEFILKNGHEKNDTIKLCLFNGEECSPANFTTTVTNYGVCYTFNSILSGKSLPVKTPGQARGLSVLLDAEQIHHVAAPRENAGFKVLVHPKDEFPNLQDFGLELELGTHSAVRIATRMLVILPRPYGTCVEDGTLKPTYLKGNYTKSKCLLECETDFIAKNKSCKCRTYYMPGSEPFCNPRELIECFHVARDEFNGIKDAVCDCEDSCKQTVYMTTVSQSTFPSYSVALSLEIFSDTTYLEEAFRAKLIGRAYRTFGAKSWEFMEYKIRIWLSTKRDKNGKSLQDSFPESFEFINDNVTNIFWSMQYDLYYNLVEHIFHEVKYYGGRSTNASYGSEIYKEILGTLTYIYVHSGLLKDRFGKGLMQEYYSKTRNISFDAFIDIVFYDYNVEGAFYTGVQEVYKSTYDTFLKQGTALYEDTDLLGLTTQYLRDNMVHVDIFFGDPKVEHITEQVDYEIFQFICDWGGALGLFFSASLLSFIETMDFCCCRRYHEKKNVKH